MIQTMQHAAKVKLLDVVRRHGLSTVEGHDQRVVRFDAMGTSATLAGD